MKRLFLAFFFIAVASASYREFQRAQQAQQIEQLQQLLQELQYYQPYVTIAKHLTEKLQDGFDPTNFIVGFNDGLGIVPFSSVQECVATLFPTLFGLEQVLQNIVTLQWNVAYILVPPLQTSLNDFNNLCNIPFTAYTTYFGPAFTALISNPLTFFGTAIDNLVKAKYDSILDVTMFLVQILQDLDYKAGQTFASIVQIAISSYVPPPVRID